MSSLRMLPLAAALVLSATHAHAHALLRKAVPPVGSTVAVAPAELSLRFSEAVEPGFTTVAVRDAAGARMDQGKPHSAPGDAATLLIQLKPLAAGTYKVEWHAVSVDTHRTEGSYSFTVAP